VKPFKPPNSLYKCTKKREASQLKKEDELIKKIRDGDKEAFGHLVRELLPSAYRTAYLILKSREHAEDALQNALEGAYISIMANKEMTAFKPWFYRVVYSKAIDLYRKNNRQKPAELYEDDQPDHQDSTQEIVIQKENKQEMLEHILSLKKEQSLPIYLHYYGDLSVKEISLILGGNANTVKTRMKRGKQMLARVLKDSNRYTEGVKANGL
jgi:RNA polymerase sigma-70 factor (ECF subfamily)